MKSLKDCINEALINEAKIKPVKTTLGEYVAWYCVGSDNFDEVDPKEFEEIEFDPTSLEDRFDGDYQKQFKFISDNRDAKITVKQTEEPGAYQANFKVGKVEFWPVSMDRYIKNTNI